VAAAAAAALSCVLLLLHVRDTQLPAGRLVSLCWSGFHGLARLLSRGDNVFFTWPSCGLPTG